MNQMSRLVFLLFALLIALGVSYYVYNLLSQKQTIVDKAPEVKTQKIAVAVLNVSRGQKLETENIRMASYLSDSLPPGAFTNIDTLVGRVAFYPINSSEPVLESSLAPNDITKGGMAAIISPKKRAMAVSVDKVIGVAGFVHPGNLVDVLISVPTKGKNSGFITKTVLENVLVLSAGTQAQEANEKQRQAVDVVTLEVTPEEGEQLALAANQGKIQLALRGYSDVEEVLTKGATVPELLENYSLDGPYKPVKIAATSTPAPKQVQRRVTKKFIVEVMNGSVVNSVTMEGR